MTTHTGPETPPPGKDASADELEADIERTREDLGNTVDELTAKLDVKAQAQHKVQDAKAQAQHKVQDAKAQAQHKVQDAKAQAQHKVQDAKQRATEQAHTVQVRVGHAAARAKETASDDRGKVKPVISVGAAVVVAAVIAVVVWRRR